MKLYFSLWAISDEESLCADRVIGGREAGRFGFVVL
jgi:hypothetical protein